MSGDIICMRRCIFHYYSYTSGKDMLIRPCMLFSDFISYSLYQKKGGVNVTSWPITDLASLGRHCHSTLPLTAIGWHSFGIYTVMLLSLLSLLSKCQCRSGLQISPRSPRI
jgi:hypothetical protein